MKRHALSGFTLIETLVALGVAGVLIATLIPISRNALFRIIRLDEEAASLNSFEQAVIATSRNQSVNGSTNSDVKTSVTKRPLPPFQYDRDMKERWQPYVMTIETRGPTGVIIRTELIRLEREAP